VGAKVGMSPLFVIMVVLVGGTLFGIVGMLLAVPVTAAASVLAKDAFERYRASRFFTEGPQP
jgi:predicted PurR-regulated permease PerM